MEQLSIKLNDSESFDAILKNSLPDGGDLQVITKENATVGGQPAIMLTFTVQLPDGSITNVQTVTTLHLFKTMLNALNARYQ